MCEPVSTATMIMMAISAAMSAYSLYTARESAKDQEKAMRDAQAIEEDQIGDQKSVEANERLRRARAERARLRASSAESGAVGISVDDVLNDVDMQAGMDLALIDANMFNATRASRAGLGSGLNRIAQPDYVGTAMSTGMQIYGAYSSDPHTAKPGAGTTPPPARIGTGP